MELHCPHRLLCRSVSCILHVGCRSDALKVFGDGGDGVAVAHPHLRVLNEALEQRVLSVEVLEVGTSVLARVGCLHLSAASIRDVLCAVADAKHRDASYELTKVYLERLLVVNREGTSAEDDTDDRGVVLRELVVGHNLAEGIKLAHTTADELRGLRTEIENNYLLLHYFGWFYCLYLMFLIISWRRLSRTKPS